MLMDPWEQIVALRRGGSDAVLISITAVRGSVPGQVGAKAIISENGLVSGTLGGGKVEAKAIEAAGNLLKSADHHLSLTWNLQRDIGMTCGGEMSFFLEKITAEAPWHIVIFGAGHVSQALIPVLTTLSCRIDVIDTRADWLGRFSPTPRLHTHLVDSISDGVSWVSARSFVLSITQGHSSDVPVLGEVLSRFPALPFLGVIGSAAKRAVLLRELRESGIEEALLEKIICPIGLPVGGNNPAEIAISIAAQLLERRDLELR
jgi:xanthine dehydrogenase accessory factor